MQIVFSTYLGSNIQMVGHMKNYLNIPEWLLKEHIFHELFKFPLLDTFLASKQPRAPLYSLSFIFFVGSLEFFLPHQDSECHSAIFLLEKWHHWLILTVSDLSIARQQSIFIFQKKQIQDQMSSSASSDEDHEEPETEPEVTFYIL